MPLPNVTPRGMPWSTCNPFPHNWVRPHQALRLPMNGTPQRYQRRTPAMVLGLTDHPWSWVTFLTTPYVPLLNRVTTAEWRRWSYRASPDSTSTARTDPLRMQHRRGPDRATHQSSRTLAAAGTQPQTRPVYYWL